MKVIVLGAGLLGVTSAYFLRQQSHDVTVIDRQASPAAETSFANGGQISVSHAEPWANPSAPLKVLQWLGKEDAPLLFRFRADAAQWRWAASFLRECLPGRAARNTAAIANLASYSDESTNEPVLTGLRDRVQVELVRACGALTQAEVVIAGERNLLSVSDYSNDMGNLRRMFDLFEQKAQLMRLLDVTGQAEGVRIFIGGESQVVPFEDLSIVSSPYEVDGKVVGTLGVIGPTRMAYDRMIQIVNITSRLVSNALSQSK